MISKHESGGGGTPRGGTTQGGGCMSPGLAIEYNRRRHSQDCVPEGALATGAAKKKTNLLLQLMQ